MGDLVGHGIFELRPGTDPSSVAALVRQNSPRVLQVSEPLSEALLDAAAEALAAAPHIGFRVYGRTVDPALNWLERFVHMRDLMIDLWHATSFDLLGSFKNLRRLALGETASRQPSLEFLRDLPALEVLRVEAHDRGFAAIGAVATLRELYLRVPRAKTLDPLRGHRRLEVLEMDFGAIRDLTPLADIAGLRGLALYQIRKLDTDDFAGLARCESLVALSIGALRNVARLNALADGPRRTLRYLTIERMTGLETLADLADCDALEQLYLVQAKPKDGRLDVAARAPALRHLVVGDHYAKQQLAATDQAFSGETLWVRGKSLRGDPERGEVAVGWRRPVAEYLALPDR